MLIMQKKCIMNFDMKILENVGHFMMMEDPERFNRILDETIDEVLLESQKEETKRNNPGFFARIKSIFH